MELAKEDFVVAIVVDGKIQSYYGVDQSSGGYPSYSTSLKFAEHYSKQEDAQQIVDRLNEHSQKERTIPYRDGVLYPDLEVLTALDLHIDKKPKVAANAVVLKLQGDLVYNKTIWGEISKPADVTYRYE